MSDREGRAATVGALALVVGLVLWYGGGGNASTATIDGGFFPVAGVAGTVAIVGAALGAAVSRGGRSKQSTLGTAALCGVGPALVAYSACAGANVWLDGSASCFVGLSDQRASNQSGFRSPKPP